MQGTLTGRARLVASLGPQLVYHFGSLCPMVCRALQPRNVAGPLLFISLGERGVEQWICSSHKALFELPAGL
jgi:hypothetical protein